MGQGICLVDALFCQFVNNVLPVVCFQLPVHATA